MTSVLPIARPGLLLPSHDLQRQVRGISDAPLKVYMFLRLYIWPAALTSELTALSPFERKHRISGFASNAIKRNAQPTITTIDIILSRLSPFRETKLASSAYSIPRKARTSSSFCQATSTSLTADPFSRLQTRTLGLVGCQCHISASPDRHAALLWRRR